MGRLCYFTTFLAWITKTLNHCGGKLGCAWSMLALCEMQFACASMEIAANLLYDICDIFGSVKIDASLELALCG